MIIRVCVGVVCDCVCVWCEWCMSMSMCGIRVCMEWCMSGACVVCGVLCECMGM